MLAIWVKVRIKPEKRQRLLDAIEVDALGWEKDEPACFRFHVLQDEQDENGDCFYEVRPGGARSSSSHAALRGLARGRRHARRSRRGDPASTVAAGMRP
jgi:hypothetical protein